MENQGLRISLLRTEKGLKQSEMARLIGISQTAYAKIESGKTKSISIEIGKGIAKALSVDFNDLFGIGNPNSKSLKNEIQELKIENEKLRQDLEVYRERFQLMKEKNMIVSPRKRDEGKNTYKTFGDKELLEYIDQLDEETIEIIKEIDDTPFLKKMLEDGIIKEGRHFQVWKEHFKK